MKENVFDLQMQEYCKCFVNTRVHYIFEEQI